MAAYDGKTVIVTGGAKGIGAGITRAFAGEGAKVASVDIDTEAGEAIAAEGAHTDRRPNPSASWSAWP